jgi:hypothetical protein
LAGSICSRTGVQAGRQRQLDDVAGARRVGVQLGDHGLDLLLGGVGRQLTANAGDTDLEAVAVLAVDVGPAAWVVPHQHRAEPRHVARCGEAAHPLFEIGLDLGRGRLPVEYPRGHRVLPTVTSKHMMPNATPIQTLLLTPTGFRAG